MGTAPKGAIIGDTRAATGIIHTRMKGPRGRRGRGGEVLRPAFEMVVHGRRNRGPGGRPRRSIFLVGQMPGSSQKPGQPARTGGIMRHDRIFWSQGGTVFGGAPPFCGLASFRRWGGPTLLIYVGRRPGN